MHPLKFAYIAIISILIFISACEAPRNNPLDPENPENKIAAIEGYVKTVQVPQIPIDGAKIVWINEGKFVYTDSEGYFNFNNIIKSDGMLTIEKESFLTDTLIISFGNKSKITESIFLNSLPTLNDMQFYSIVENSFRPNPKYSLAVKVDISDDENDVDSVFIENQELETEKQLIYNISSKYYENTISLEDLNNISIDIVIGKEFIITVYDSESKRFEIGKSNIKRIIKEEVEPRGPLGRDTIDTGNPLLEWEKFSPGFQFGYLLEIYTDEIDPILSWEKEVNSEEIQYLTNANLPSGDYFWVIWAIDEFKNRTRSKPASFIIK